MLGKLMRRLRYLWRREERGRLLADEVESHLALHVEALMEDGLSQDAAEASARRRFGNATLIREDARSVWIARWLDELIQDLKYALRSLRRQPGFTAVAIASASLGIGGCATIFGVANAALFRTPPNVAEPASLATIVPTEKGEPGSGFPYPELVEIREKQQSLAAVGAVFPFVPANIGDGVTARHEWGWLVTANYFDLLGIRPYLGRGFLAEEDAPGAAPAILLSHRLWQDRFGADSAVVGREILFNGRNTRVVGVAPPGFHGHEAALTADYWVPLSMLDRIPFPKGGYNLLKDRVYSWFWPVARLRPGVSIAQANGEFAVIAAQFRATDPARWKERGFYVEQAGQLQAGLRRIFSVFFGALLAVAFMVLLIACSNIANLLLARGASRQAEIATRLAIGAGSGRLIRQLVTESLVLGLLGGVGGLGLAFYAGRMIGRFRLPMTAPIDFTIKLDGHVAAFAVVLSIVTGLVLGLAPALRVTRRDLTTALHTRTATTAGWRRFGLRNGLIVAQVAVSAILLIASTLFLRSLTAAQDMDLGMSARDVLLVQIDPPANGYDTARTRRFFETLASRLSAVPGVRAVSYTNLPPLSFITASGLFVTEEQRSDPRATPIHTQAVMIGPRYFDTLGIPLVRGQDFGAERVGAEGVLIVNEAFARKAFRDQDPIGRRVYRDGKPYRIIGLAATSKVRTIGEDPEPAVFHSFAQNAEQEEMPMGLTLAVRTAGEPSAWLPAVKEQVAGLDRSLPVFDVRTMKMHLRGALLLPRMTALMFGLAGGVGLLIASIGVYGIVSFAVARRTREIGLRMAIGARRDQILRMILGHGMGLTAAGLALGVAAALPAMRLASSLLYGVSPFDPLTFLAAPACLLLVALTASLIPAYRATRLDPVTTLKHE